MRRALGLDNDQPRTEAPAPSRPQAEFRPAANQPVQRRDADRRPRRFVKDGEVPVVVLNGSRDHPGAETASSGNRVASLESAVAAERTGRERAERALHDAQIVIQHLQTQVAHANLAHNEAISHERSARSAAEEALAASIVAKEAAERACAEAIAERESVEGELAALKRETALRQEQTPRQEEMPFASAPARAPKQAGRRSVRVAKPEVVEAEPEPVKWWLPSYKATLRKR